MNSKVIYPKTPPKPLHCDQPFVDGAKTHLFTVKEFWTWMASDLLSNATRGVLAEYIVARALDIQTDGVRDEWAEVDLITKAGLKIEVKSCGRIQTWEQSKLSSVKFSIKPTKSFDAESGKYSLNAARRADCYVFCLHKHVEQATANPLDLSQWEFYVVPTVKLNEQYASAKTIGLKALKELSQPLSFDGLKNEVSKLETVSHTSPMTLSPVA